MGRNVKHASFKNGNVAYTDTGKGRAVVFLHGFLEASNMWNYYVKHLPKAYRKICIDLPGHGQTDNFGYNHSMEIMADAVRAVLKQIDVRKAVFVGHSMGGYVALALAEGYPEMCNGVLLYFSSAAADNAEKKKNRNRAIDVVKKNHPLFVQSTVPFLFTDKNRAKYEKTIARLVLAGKFMSKQGIIAALEGMRDRSDREIVLKFAPFKIGFVIGKEDPVLPYKNLLVQAEINPDTQVYLLEKTGHMGHIENKKETFASTRSFLDFVYFKGKE
jgi:pimeloyl-ACP methyl ester carboxylesterase